ncbi:MFS transporter [Streptomyces sp. TLI_171]|uniref:MFS transporter n=1 Tax=Streptomyces sp. TLI_171 TaxID=1938859 RepID=UPI000C1A6A65|nr:MFS transporter [Streptomyces sp. TLI_171]RKE18267.1 MFS transporter [Streptomyces sp. TLI_171]
MTATEPAADQAAPPAPAPNPPAGLLARLLPADRVLRRLTWITLVNTVGTGLGMTLGAVFFTRIVGFPVATVGVVLTVAGACGVAAGVPAGRLSDRFGPKPVLMVLLVLQAVCAAGYVLVRSLPLFVVLACLVAVADRGGSAARGALFAEVLAPDARVTGRAYLRSVTNIGLSLGTVAAAAVLQLDSRGAYVVALLVDAVSYAVIAVLYGLLVPVPARTAAQVEEAVSGPNPALRDRLFLAVTGLNAVITLQFMMIEVGVPLWVVRNTDAPRWMVAGGLLVNTALVIVLQVRATRGTEEPAAAARIFRRGALLVAASCLVVGLAAGMPGWVAAVVIAAGVALQALGEVYSQAGAWALSYDLAKEGAHGAYQGVFNTGMSGALMLGPVLITSVVIAHGLFGWALLAAMFAAAGWGMTALVRR